MSLSTNVSNLATRIATEVKAIRTLVNGNVADLSALSTTDKTNLVASINEVKGLVDLIDLTDLINDTEIVTNKTWSSSLIAGWFGSGISDMPGSTVMDRLTAINTKIGTLDNLTTDDKTSIVAAINELDAALGNIDLTGLIDDNNFSTTTTWSSSKITEEISAVLPSLTGGAGIDYNSGIISVDYSGMVGGLGVDSLDRLEINRSVVDGWYDAAGAAATAEANAVTSANAYTDSRINDGVTSTAKTWSSSKISTEIGSAVAAVVDMAPAALDTLNELAAALGDDANYAATITTALSGKADAQHTHAISDVTGLQEALDAKASSANVGDTTVNYVTTFEAGLV